MTTNDYKEKTTKLVNQINESYEQLNNYIYEIVNQVGRVILENTHYTLPEELMEEDVYVDEVYTDNGRVYVDTEYDKRVPLQDLPHEVVTQIALELPDVVDIDSLEIA